MNWNSIGRYCVLIAMSLITISCIGCKDRSRASARKAARKTSVAQEEPREISKRVYEAWTVDRVADLSALDDLKGKIELDKLWKVSENEPEIVWPEGADEDLKLTMEMFLSKPSLNTVYSFPADQLDCRVSIDMSVDGKLLYIVDKQNKVHIVDIDAKADKITFDAPIESAYGIMADATGEHVFLVNSKEMVKVELASEKIVGTVRDIPGKIMDWDRARENNTMVGYTDQHKLVVFDNEFKGLEVVPDVETKSGHVAIHPEGKYILGSSTKSIFRWYINEEPHRMETLRADQIDYRYMPVTSDYDVDRWFDFMWLHEYAARRPTVSYTVDNVHYPFIIGIRITDAVSCGDGDNSWATMVGILANGEPNQQQVLCSIRWKPSLRSENSSITPIDAKTVSRMWSDRNGGRIALYTDSDIRVCDRYFFDDTEGTIMPHYLAKRIYNDQFNLIDQCAKFLRSRNWPKKFGSGEDMYENILNRVSFEWQWIEANPNSAESPAGLAALNAAKEEGNELALVASAIHHLSTGYRARGSGYADEVSREGFVELDRRGQLAEQDLKKVLASERPPAAAFTYMVKTQMTNGDSIDDGLKTIKRCIELYPDYLSVHSAMTSWLLPRWGGAPGAVQAYADKVASLYPEAVRDQVYTIIMLDALDYCPNEALFGPDEANADLVRIFKSAELMRDQNLISRFHCEVLCKQAILSNDDAKLKEWATYHLKSHASPTQASQASILRMKYMFRKVQNISLAETGKEYVMGSESGPHHGASPYSSPQITSPASQPDSSATPQEEAQIQLQSDPLQPIGETNPGPAK